MQAVARRKIDMSVQALLQDRLDVNQIKRVEPVRPLWLNEDIDVAVVAGHAASGRSEEVERTDSMRSDLRQATLQFRQNPISVQDDCPLPHRLLQVLVDLDQKALGREPLLVGSDKEREILGHETRLDRIDAHFLKRRGEFG